MDSLHSIPYPSSQSRIARMVIRTNAITTGGQYSCQLLDSFLSINLYSPLTTHPCPAVQVPITRIHSRVLRQRRQESIELCCHRARRQYGSPMHVLASISERLSSQHWRLRFAPQNAVRAPV